VLAGLRRILRGSQPIGACQVFTLAFSPLRTDAAVPAGRLAWFENPRTPGAPWMRHDLSRRQRGMFDKFVARDMDGDGDVDFVSTRGTAAGTTACSGSSRCVLQRPAAASNRRGPARVPSWCCRDPRSRTRRCVRSWRLPEPLRLKRV
jgi:hypothetical protein